MGNDRYSISYYARGTLTIGVVLLTSGIILIITSALLAAVCQVQSEGPIQYWFLLLFAGFIAVVPGILLLFISRRLGKM